MEKLQKTMEILGLSAKESQIYLMLLTLGSAPASVAGQRCQIKRSMAQYICKQLVEKGLLRVQQKRSTYYYTAEEPEKLLLLLEREKRSIERKERVAKSMIGELQDLVRPERSLPHVRFYEGIQGIERLVDDLPNTRNDISTFSAGDYIRAQLPELVDRHRKRSAEHYKRKRIIRCKKYEELHKDDRKDLRRETRYFQNIAELPVDIQIIDNCVSMTSIVKHAPVGIIIEHEDIANAMRMIFDQVWDNLL